MIVEKNIDNNHQSYPIKELANLTPFIPLKKDNLDSRELVPKVTCYI